MIMTTINSISIEAQILDLIGRKRGVEGIAGKSHGRGSKVRARLWRAIRYGHMSQAEFNRRFQTLLTYDTPEMNHGYFDQDEKNQQALEKLQSAQRLIREANQLISTDIY